MKASSIPGDTVLLSGQFQLDGIHLAIDKPLRLRGEAIDNDGDAQINEDWTGASS